MIGMEQNETKGNRYDVSKCVTVAFIGILLICLAMTIFMPIV